MIAQRIIEKKREGEVLTPAELAEFLDGYLRGDVAEYQMSSFLMAVVFRGLVPSELTTLVDRMLHSGRVLDLSGLPGPHVDKHSTGGVGDKVSLVLAPLAAQLGLSVPMMSGRGLGHSGGTLDKLEAIPGLKTDLTIAEFEAVLARHGFAMIGQTEEIAPLDKRLYALRSVTGTVPSIPLVTASIMSKKLAEDLDGLVLDVKVGRGSFFPDEGDARRLAETMVGVGVAHGVRTTALLTDMDHPLGRAIGNALEVREAVECLRGEGPPDLRELVIELTAEMVAAGDAPGDPGQVRAEAGRLLDDGTAFDAFRGMVADQGGDPDALTKADGLGVAPAREDVCATRAGYVAGIEPVTLGLGVVAMGGGRTSLGAAIDPRVGFVLHVAPGDPVSVGQPLGTVHAADAGGLADGVRRLRDAIELMDGPPALKPLIRGRIEASP